MPRKRQPKPLFLARPSYRRRRLRDAARLLPVFGILFLILPLLWSAPGDGPRDTGGDLIYFFGVWVLLVAMAAGFAPGLSAGSEQDAAEDDD